MAEQRALIDSCHGRILAKARDVLDAGQFAEFQAWDKDYVANTKGQISESTWNRTAPFYYLLIIVYFFIVLPLSCVWSCGGLIRDELQTDTLGFLTTRPIKRATLVVLKSSLPGRLAGDRGAGGRIALAGRGALRQIPTDSARCSRFFWPRNSWPCWPGSRWVFSWGR